MSLSSILYSQSSKKSGWRIEEWKQFELYFRFITISTHLSSILSYLSSNGNRGERIRTSDPLRPRQVRYQAALRPD